MNEQETSRQFWKKKKDFLLQMFVDIFNLNIEYL